MFECFRIKNLIQDRPAYLVTAISHVDDLYISEYLDIPIYGSFHILFDSALNIYNLQS